MEGKKSLVYYDGLCGLCDKFVSFLLYADRKSNILRFAPLQSEKAQELYLPKEELLSSIIFVKNGKVYKKSSAILKILNEIGGVWRLFLLGYFIPKFIRDFIYDVIAKNRYSIFGKKQNCRIPSPAEKSKFILD